MTPIQIAVKRVKTQEILAKELTKIHPDKPVSQQSISKWIKRGHPPPDYCIALELITGIYREDLRPDVFLPPPNQSPR